MPLAAGVFEDDGGGLSPFELFAVTARVIDVADEESFKGDSSLAVGMSDGKS